MDFMGKSPSERALPFILLGELIVLKNEFFSKMNSPIYLKLLAQKQEGAPRFAAAHNI